MSLPAFQVASRPTRQFGEKISSNTPSWKTPSFAVARAIITIALLPTLIIWCSRRLVREVPRHHEAHLSEVIPIPCHSHNDFWRQVPLISALEAGCIGVEVDVWPYEGELFVGHSRDALLLNRTFKGLYIESLTRELDAKNPQTEIHPSQAARGLFNSDPAQTLVLLVDVKADPAKTWPLLVQSLEPLRGRGWLTTVRGETIDTGPVTVVVTGKSPTYVLERVHDGTSTPRDIFLDAPLSALRHSAYHKNNSYWASDSFTKKVGYVWLGRLRPRQLLLVRQHVQDAHSRGLKVRYWGLPAWPLPLRDHVWKTLVREGVDIINVDDIGGVAKAWSQLRMEY